jgi:hypothetical protein
VRVVVGTVAEIRATVDGVRLLLGDGDASVDCDVVVVGVGMAPDLGLAVAAGLAADRGVLVDDHQRTSNPRVFAVGDIARTTAHPSAGHWDAARRGSAVAAAAVLGVAPPPARAPWFWSDRYDTHVEVVGEFTAAGANTVVRGRPAELSFVAFALREGRCVGAVSVNREREMAAVRRLVDRRAPVAADALRADDVDLRSLARR